MCPPKSFPAFILVFAIGIFSGGEILAQSFAAGKAAFAAKNFDRARKIFSQRVANNPDDGNSYFYLGYMDEIDTKYASSVGHFQKAVRGNIKRKLRDLAYWKIINYYRYHQNWEMVYKYARARLQYGENKKIQEILDKAAELRNPNLITANKQVGEAQSAIAEGNHDHAITLLESALNLVDDMHDARFQLASLLQKTGKFKRSRYHWEKLVAKFPDNPLYRLRYGLALVKSADYTQARDELEKARSSGKIDDNKQAYYLDVALGQTYAQLDQRSSALSAYRRALKRRPSSFSAAFGIAQLHYQAGKFQAARRAAVGLAGKKKDHAGLHFVLGMSYYRTNEKSRALGHLNDMAIALNKAGEAHLLKSYYKDAILPLGYLHSEQDNFKEAAYYLRMAGSDEGNTRNYNFYYGKALYYTNQLSEARTYLQKVHNSAGALFLMSKIYAREMNTESAKDFLKRSADLRPNYWNKAAEDPAFESLRGASPDFDNFITYKGNPPAKKPVPAPKEQPSPEDLEFAPDGGSSMVPLNGG